MWGGGKSLDFDAIVAPSLVLDLADNYNKKLIKKLMVAFVHFHDFLLPSLASLVLLLDILRG